MDCTLALRLEYLLIMKFRALLVIAIQKYSPVSITHARGPLLSVGFGLMVLVGTVLLLGHLLLDDSTVVLIAIQWTFGLFVYSFTVYMLDQSVRTGMRDLLKLGFGKQ